LPGSDSQQGSEALVSSLADMSPRMAIRILLVRLGYAVGRLRPTEAAVVLATSHAPRISGNLAWIRDALAEHEPAVSVRILADQPSRSRRALAMLALHSIRAGYELARARVFVVDDYFFPRYVVPRRRGTRTIQVWHAAGAFKKFGYSVLDKGFGATGEFVQHVRVHANYDLALVSAMRFAPMYAEAFRQPLSVFSSHFGIPRSDLLVDPDRAAAAGLQVRQRYGLPEGRRVILYAPTFRGEQILDARSPLDLDLTVLERTLGRDHVVLLRQHPFVREQRPLPAELAGFVIDASDHPDINALMLVSDVLVTDYSSAIYEFALLGRPMAFFAPDHAAYEAERGFYFDYESGVPGPVFDAAEPLAEYLRAGRFDLDRVARFRDESWDVADGRATERLITEALLPGLG
jgi:teichoic acid ribitol-phosphate primase